MTRQPWNKGLTVADPRVASAEEKRRASRVYIAPIGRSETQKRYAARLRERDPLGLYNRAKRALCLARQAGNYAEHVDYRLIVERDKWVCYLCNLVIVPDDLSFDHVTPLSKGGEHTHENVKVVHAACNSRKRDRDYDGG